MAHQFILDALQKVSPDRLQRAIHGLANGSYHVYLSHYDPERVSGTVMNGEGREYAVSIGNGYVSCDCSDFAYRKVTCKHILAVVLRVLSAQEVGEEPEKRPFNLKLGKVRPTWQAAA